MLGILIVSLISALFPRLLSTYGIYGVMINVGIGVAILAYAEGRALMDRYERLSFKWLMIVSFFAALIAAILLQSWMYIELMDSPMTSSFNGVLMRVDGELTARGWINLLEFTLIVPLIALMIAAIYEVIRKLLVPSH